MKHIMLAAALLAFTGAAHAQTAQKSAAECGADPPNPYLRLSPAEFDQRIGKGWRLVGNEEGCELAGADLIATYRDEVMAKHIAGLNGHEAQLRASAGDFPKAAELYRRNLAFSVAQAAEMQDYSDVLYIEATIAYLERDRATLEAKRAQLAALPKPDWHDEVAARYLKENPKAAASLTWPRNLNVVDGLIACFDKPYREAYSAACQPKPQQ